MVSFKLAFQEKDKNLVEYFRHTGLADKSVQMWTVWSVIMKQHTVTSMLVLDLNETSVTN